MTHEPSRQPESPANLRPGREGRLRTGGTAWARLPVALAPVYFGAAAGTTAALVALLVGIVVMAGVDLPRQSVAAGAWSAGAVWLVIFGLWLWWPQRRKLARRQRARRREARRRLAAIKSADQPPLPPTIMS